jgi:hypothetical protein
LIPVIVSAATSASVMASSVTCAVASNRASTDHSYGVLTGGRDERTKILCTQDAMSGGWESACNAYCEPWTQADGKLYSNLPKWSVVIFTRK